MTVVLLNILIALLSNVFSRLEEQQQLISLKDKADMILEFEMIVRLFRKIKGKGQRRSAKAGGAKQVEVGLAGEGLTRRSILLKKRCSS